MLVLCGSKLHFYVWIMALIQNMGKFCFDVYTFDYYCQPAGRIHVLVIVHLFIFLFLFFL